MNLSIGGPAAGFVLFLLAGLASACASHPPVPVSPSAPVAPREVPFVARPIDPFLGERWIGQGISYGPHRDGQSPGGPSPTRAQLREDLEILRDRWGLLRVYSADAVAADLLALIREERLPFKVLLGAWIAPDGPAANRLQVETAVRLANAYSEIVLAICVGNETQVSWSDHKVPAETLVGWIRAARRASKAPVTTADDFGFWIEPRSEQVAREVDFVVAHVYAMWNGLPLEGALGFTQEKYAEVVRIHAGRPILLGEAGWATRKHTEGDQGKLIKGEPGQLPQRVFYEQFSAWVRRERIVSTWFEAFDENWKGGSHPDEVEKHWGLFSADRVPKAAVSGTRDDPGDPLN
jgi:exo-beta-1,3-glucanase (GH17 family)